MPRSDSPRVVEFVVPGDPNQNTGGYRYVRLLVQALNQSGYKAGVTGIPGRFPRPDGEAKAALDCCLRGHPDGGVVVLDGLAMGGMPEVVQAHGSRLQLIALVHHPLADETGLGTEEQRWFFDSEKRALAAVAGVITTSRYIADRLADFGVRGERIRTIEPGVGPIPERTISRSLAPVPVKIPGILCVAHFSPRKAQHQLIEALIRLKSLPWHCTLAGSCAWNPEYSARVRAEIDSAGLGSRVAITGEVSGPRLLELYRQADLFVLPSLYEGYGMVVDEALASGLPVIASDGGALAQTAERAGVVQYEAGDVDLLAARLEAWLADPLELAHQTELAWQESTRTRSWEQAATEFQAALAELLERMPQSVFDGEWLWHREEADHAARSAALTSGLCRWLHSGNRRNPVGRSPGTAVTIVDLGAGQGSNAAYLVPKLDIAQQWLLLDQDPVLLAEAQKRLADLDIGLSLLVAQLKEDSLDHHLPAEVSVITASALIDLVSESWLRALADAVVKRGSALLVALSVDGRFELDPPHERDEELRALINQHQLREKGVGQALGADATRVLKNLMEGSGYTVSVAGSPWRLGPDDAPLSRRLIEGWVQAATEQGQGHEAWLSEWMASRKAQLAAGALSITVHHLDMLALPGEAWV